MINNTSKRIEWVDIAKYICIMCVIIHHWDVNGELIRPLWLYRFYQPFFLTGFCFLSGYTYKHREGFNNHIIRKFKQLLIPFLFFGIGNILLGYIVSLHPEDHTSLSTEIIQHFIQVRFVYGQMWFLAALFVAYVPFYFIIKKYEETKNEKMLLIASLIIFVFCSMYFKLMPSDLLPWGGYYLPWHIDYAIFVNSFMIVGYLLKDKNIKFNKFLASPLLSLSMYSLILLIDYNLNIRINLLSSILMDLITYILAILSLVNISKKIKTNAYFSYVGQNTLIYFGIHLKAQQVLTKVFSIILPKVYFSLVSNSLFGLSYVILMSLVLSILLVIPAYIINKYFPFVLGKWYKKKTI